MILDPEDFARLGRMGEDEIEMIDLAYGATPTSRLGCQTLVGDEHDGLTVRVAPNFPG